jgi:long-subunit acyl-CoA synthetase (AMP-forming)
MSRVLAAIRARAERHPQATAVRGAGVRLNYAELWRAIDQAAGILSDKGVRVVAIGMDNGPAWAIWDLAALKQGVCVVPLSPFFSPQQLAHTLNDAGVEAVLDDTGRDFVVAGLPVGWTDVSRAHPAALPPDTAKVTYTSGTTGTPKGVCLSAEAVDGVAASLALVATARPTDRHLSVLPLGVLLENVAGLYVPLSAGACVVLRPLRDIGLQGSSTVDARSLHAALGESAASTTVMVPGMLEALAGLEGIAGFCLPHLRLLAVGGGRVAPGLIRRARNLGLPVYQGYGLSECASVVSLNRPGDDDLQTVGRPLPHLAVTVADSGEVLVRNPGFLGYLGDPDQAPAWLPTGDLGRFDANGHLHILGRIKNVFITAFGRNVSPEWVESGLTAETCIHQAAVYGESRPFNVAVIVSDRPASTIRSAVARVNARLPDYARVGAWLVADAPFGTGNGQATANGRPRRERICAVYAARLEELYEGANSKEKSV